MTNAVRVLVTPRDDNHYQRLLYAEMSTEEAVIRYLDGPTAPRASTSCSRRSRSPGTAWAAISCCTSTGSSSSTCRGRAAQRPRDS
jgi:hypothetical protein